MLYPALNPYAHGWLDVGQGHRMYWEQCGNPQGQPVVYLHGGPGGGCSEIARQYFNPQHYRIVLFDQRGCGRSTPHASTQDNTLAHLLADMELLRQHLQIDRWLLCGVSWGCTLALAYTRAQRARVQGLLLRSVFTAQKSELAWLYQAGGAGALAPQAWQDFEHGLDESPKAGGLTPPVACGASPPLGVEPDLLKAYAQRLRNGTPTQQMLAAQAWCRWEQAISSVHTSPGVHGGPDTPPNLSPQDAAHCLAQARIATHYFTQDADLQRPDLLWPPDYLGGIPGILVQGQGDLVSPSVTAWLLAQQWPGSQLRMVAEAGHVSSDLPLRKVFMSALEEMEFLCL